MSKSAEQSMDNKDFVPDTQGPDVRSGESEAVQVQAMAGEMEKTMARVSLMGAEMRRRPELEALTIQYESDRAALRESIPEPDASEKDHRRHFVELHALETKYMEARSAIIQEEMQKKPPVPFPEHIMNELAKSEIGMKTQAALKKIEIFFADDLNKLVIGSVTTLPLVATGMGASSPDKLLQTYAIAAGIGGLTRLGIAGVEKFLGMPPKKETVEIKG